MPDNGSLRPGFAATQRSRVRRHPERGHYDSEAVYAILDAAMMCHVGYVIDGLPYVTPTLFWREGDRLYWHGSSASRMLRAQREGIPVCLTVSHIDGLVLARCAFRHSLNYRAKTSPSDRKSTRLNSSHVRKSYAVFCLKNKNHDLECRTVLEEIHTYLRFHPYLTRI